MKNINRLANYVTKYGSDSIMIHTIPGTSNWIICQKIEEDKWSLTMENPMGNVTYNLGVVTEAEHVQLWAEITKMSIENKASQLQQAKQLTNKIDNFKKNYASSYRKLVKTEQKATNGIRHRGPQSTHSKRIQRILCRIEKRVNK